MRTEPACQHLVAERAHRSHWLPCRAPKIAHHSSGTSAPLPSRRPVQCLANNLYVLLASISSAVASTAHGLPTTGLTRPPCQPGFAPVTASCIDEVTVVVFFSSGDEEQSQNQTLMTPGWDIDELFQQRRPPQHYPGPPGDRSEFQFHAHVQLPPTGPTCWRVSDPGWMHGTGQ